MLKSTHAIALMLTVIASTADAQFYYDAQQVLPPPGVDESFGEAIDMSATRVLVGAEFSDVNGQSSGSAYLYSPNNGAFIRELVSPDIEIGDAFGSDVALYGNLALVGARLDEGTIAQQGRAYLFDINTGAQLRRLRASDPTPLANFGSSVAMYGDIIAVGAPVSQNIDGSLGAVYVYSVSFPTDTEIVRLNHDFFSNDDRFGQSVDVSADYIAVGASGIDPVATDEAVYIFDIVTGNRLQRLTPDNPDPWEDFGRSIVIIGDAIVVGAPSNTTAGTSRGSVYIFDIINGNQVARIQAEDPGPFDKFGFSVATNGGVILVGAPSDDDAGGDAGAVYVYSGFNLDLIDKVKPSELDGLENFGHCVALAGQTLVAGARPDG